ncbi:MAG: hypothetical protein IJ068_05995 [Bacilli bacterium]|nr:hypothetical protein [Bacilli bacterium]
MLFKRKKIRLEKIKHTKENIKKIFKENIEDYENYNLVYAYNREFDLEVNDYIYTSLILGYDTDNMRLIILEVDKEFQNVFNIIKLCKKDFTKAIYSKQMDEYIIYLNNKKSDKINFSLITENYIDTDILAFIEQSTEVDDFKDFYLDFKRKSRLKKNKGDK